MGQLMGLPTIHAMQYNVLFVYYSKLYSLSFVFEKELELKVINCN